MVVVHGTVVTVGHVGHSVGNVGHVGRSVGNVGHSVENVGHSVVGQVVTDSVGQVGQLLLLLGVPVGQMNRKVFFFSHVQLLFAQV